MEEIENFKDAIKKPAPDMECYMSKLPIGLHLAK